MNLRTLAAFAAAVLILTLGAGPAEAAGATSVESGWWNEATVGPVSAPATANADQLQVSYDLSGPLAFAAVRIRLPASTPGGSLVTLHLNMPSGSSVGTPAVSACPTTSNWKAGPDQQKSAAPGYSCQSGRQADGTVSASVERWVVPAAWASDGVLSVALVPTPGATSPFSVTYAAPSSTSVTVAAPGTTAPQSPAEPAPVQTVAPSPAPAPAGAVAGGATSTGGGASAIIAGPGSVATVPGVGPSLGAVPGSSSVPSAGASASTVPSGAPAAVAAPASARPGGGAASGSGPGRAGRILAFCLLVATGLALFFLAARPDRPPRLLGPLGMRGSGRPAGALPVEAPMGGIGRFARPRLAPPPRL